MTPSDFDMPVRAQRARGSPIHRGVLVISLCALLCILGIATYTINTVNNAQASAPNPAPLRPAANVVKHSRIQTTRQPVKARPTPKATAQTTPIDSATQSSGTPLGQAVFSGNLHLSEIALTFDDGPNPIYTPQILSVLRTYDVKATFFDVGYLVKDFPNIVRQEFLEGNSIGNHSWSHPELTRLSAASIATQLTSASDAIQSVTGMRPALFRPPYGSFNATVIAQATRLNLTAIIWNDESRDWTTPGVNVIVARILNLARNGSIILLHDGGGFRAQTVAALPIIIESLRRRGFTLVTIPQLLHDMHSSANATGTTSNAVSPIALMPDLTAWKQE